MESLRTYRHGGAGQEHHRQDSDRFHGGAVPCACFRQLLGVQRNRLAESAIFLLHEVVELYRTVPSAGNTSLLGGVDVERFGQPIR